MQPAPDALILFSGGLDSLLAAKLLEAQGLSVLCLHFYSPFFGNPKKVIHWQNTYGIGIEAIDATVPFVTMLAKGAAHGTGKTLNPCVDCKILLLELAKLQLARAGAKFLATGEVLGQRPMSQRRDALNIISKRSDTREILLRPLSAQLLPPTPMEESGLVDREKLLRISGRGRNEQLALAENFGISEIPSPAGGCRLTERENARRYWPLLRKYRETGATRPILELCQDFRLANCGRMLMDQARRWFCVGKNEADNKNIAALAQPEDLLLRLSLPGPVALLRNGTGWPETAIRQAAEVLASYAPRAGSKGNVDVSARGGASAVKIFRVEPKRHEQEWNLPTWEEVQLEIQAERRELEENSPKCRRHE